jgi:N-acetylglucosamine-6-phosphate deacetylase
MYTVLKNGIILTGSQRLHNCALIIENDRIKDIVAENDISDQAEIINCNGNYIATGLIDLQIYGGGGLMFSDDPSPGALKQMADSLVASGTTSFLVTLATNSLDIFRKAIKVVKENPHPAVLGLHFEGPYLNSTKSGAHLKQFIKKAGVDEVSDLLSEADGCLKMMTIAPELCSDEVIALLKENNVVISAGHSNATFAEAIDGFNKGVTTATHLFNAMSGLHHRDTGLPGAIFNSADVYSSVIADGIHIDYPSLKISKKVMGERLFLITDAVEESRGPYTHVRKTDRYTLDDGTLSGSMLTMLTAVKNCVQHAGIELEEALRMASVYPAKVIGNDKIGRIAIGSAADIIVFDKELSLKQVFSKGTSIWLD